MLRAFRGNRLPAGGVRHEPAHVGVSPDEVVVSRVHEEQAAGVLAGSVRRPQRAFDRFGGSGRYVLENLDSDPPELARGPQDRLRPGGWRPGPVRAGREYLRRHPPHPQLVEAPDEVCQGLLLFGRSHRPPVHPRPGDSEPVAVPLDARHDLQRILKRGAQDRVEEGNRHVGGEELIRQLDAVQGD